MQVSFKSLYRIPGSSASQPKDAYGNNSGGKNIGEMRSTTFYSFLEDIKPFRSQSGYSFYDKSTGDYYIGVSDALDSKFEDVAIDYNIDYYRLGKKLARNNAPVKAEIKAFDEAMMSRLRDRFGISNNNIDKKG